MPYVRKIKSKNITYCHTFHCHLPTFNILQLFIHRIISYVMFWKFFCALSNAVPLFIYNRVCMYVRIGMSHLCDTFRMFAHKFLCWCFANNILCAMTLLLLHFPFPITFCLTLHAPYRDVILWERDVNEMNCCHDFYDSNRLHFNVKKKKRKEKEKFFTHPINLVFFISHRHSISLSPL